MSFRHRIRALMLGLATAAAFGCAAPAPEPATAAPAAPEASSPSPGGSRSVDRTAPRDATRDSTRSPERAPPMSDPLPPQREETPKAAVGTGSTVAVDRSCRTDADCTVKDVGNCCGYFPACVNVKSPTDPKGVQAQCARDGMASVCGFEEIRGCQCIKGQCQGDSSARLIQ